MHSSIKIALIAVALLAGFFAPELLKGVKDSPSSESLSEYCMLSTKTCNSDGVSMAMDTDITRPLVPSTITVHWPDTQAKQLSVTLEGVEMDMGVAKYILSKQPDGAFSGEVLLPVCTTEKMTWMGEISDGQQARKAALRMQQ
ncbi:hypothetical protein [Vibrio sonorensis]|uniref:hypothetical protein n=1 Tax=Vibrio sonorensis TaxID=1004316 RepID=UPI0008DA3577|nr:hypothetical protein [Vibrio sonorensis]